MDGSRNDRRQGSQQQQPQQPGSGNGPPRAPMVSVHPLQRVIRRSSNKHQQSQIGRSTAGDGGQARIFTESEPHREWVRPRESRFAPVFTEVNRRQESATRAQAAIDGIAYPYDQWAEDPAVNQVTFQQPRVPQVARRDDRQQRGGVAMGHPESRRPFFPPPGLQHAGANAMLPDDTTMGVALGAAGNPPPFNSFAPQTPQRAGPGGPQDTLFQQQASVGPPSYNPMVHQMQTPQQNPNVKPYQQGQRPPPPPAFWPPQMGPPNFPQPPQMNPNCNAPYANRAPPPVNPWNTATQPQRAPTNTGVCLEAQRQAFNSPAPTQERIRFHDGTSYVWGYGPPVQGGIQPGRSTRDRTIVPVDNRHPRPEGPRQPGAHALAIKLPPSPPPPRPKR